MSDSDEIGAAADDSALGVGVGVGVGVVDRVGVDVRLGVEVGVGVGVLAEGSETDGYADRDGRLGRCVGTVMPEPFPQPASRRTRTAAPAPAIRSFTTRLPFCRREEGRPETGVGSTHGLSLSSNRARAHSSGLLRAHGMPGQRGYPGGVPPVGVEPTLSRS